MFTTVACLGSMQMQNEALRLCPAALAAAHILKLLRPPIEPAAGCLPLS